MPSLHGPKPRWQQLYDLVTAENDPQKLTDLVARIEEAMMNRAEEIAHSPNHADEWNAMLQASKHLLAIKTEKLNFPPIEMK
jgi:hypothetical protein